LAVPGTRPLAIAEAGAARESGRPDRSRRYPLVVVSHGYGAWGTAMSRLCEALASRGYVVAAIDHRDQPVRDLASFQSSFASVLRHRAADQRQVLLGLLGGKLASAPVSALIDPKAVGLIGYSMGGYGALITAGAAVDRKAPVLAQLAPGQAEAIAQPDAATAARIKAVVALAPWGAQPDSAVWSDAGLAALAKPLLLISGNRDDVVDFDRGVTRIFKQARSSDRYLLVYREAAHNIAGNPVELPPDADFGVIEAVSDPVWRKDRIDAINQHFITAFLDLHLAGDAAKASYLNVPTVVSDDGQWPSTFGTQWGGTLAGDAQPGYWRGFQRRWARGLEMHHRGTGQ
jgi:predicted dienelactone hydrolase